MNNHELKVANTKRLFKALLTVSFLISTYKLMSTDEMLPKEELAPLRLNVEAFAKPNSNSVPVAEELPIDLTLDLTLSLSLKIDFGTRLNSILRDFVNRR